MLVRMTVVMWIFEKVDLDGVDWIYLAQDRDRWLIVVNIDVILWVP